MYRLSDLETDLSETCNLRCTHCSHMSPHYTTADVSYSLNQFEHDINILSKLIKVDVFRIVGGEPLLNKRLDEYTKIIKSSGMAKAVSLFTNGILLSKVNLVFLQNIDELRVSLYTFKNSNNDAIVACLKQIKIEYPHLHIAANKVQYFTKANLIEKNEDKNIVDKIYDKCYHSRHGKSLFNGRIYRCFVDRKRPKFFETYKHIMKSSINDYDSNRDSLAVNKSLTPAAVQVLFNTNTPLRSCEWCLGCSGRYFKHSQLSEITKSDDYATLQDLNFDEGSSYVSNCLYNWYSDRLDHLTDEPNFDVSKLGDHDIHHSDPVEI